MIRWQVITVQVQSGVQSDLDRVDELLLDGWEPFAVTTQGSSHYYHIRKSYRLP